MYAACAGDRLIRQPVASTPRLSSSAGAVRLNSPIGLRSGPLLRATGSVVCPFTNTQPPKEQNESTYVRFRPIHVLRGHRRRAHRATDERGRQRKTGSGMRDRTSSVPVNPGDIVLGTRLEGNGRRRRYHTALVIALCSTARSTWYGASYEVLLLTDIGLLWDWQNNWVVT